MLTGSNLRALRNLRGITQIQLAKLAQCSPTAIAEYETSKRELRSDTIRRLCVALGVTITYTINGTSITCDATS